MRIGHLAQVADSFIYVVSMLGVTGASTTVNVETPQSRLSYSPPHGFAFGCWIWCLKETYSISAGLDYPGVGPEHAWLKDSGRAKYVPVHDSQCLIGFRALCETEGIIPALESSHAIYAAIEAAKELGPGKDVLVTVSGRGDKDVESVAKALPKLGPIIGWELELPKISENFFKYKKNRACITTATTTLHA